MKKNLLILAGAASLALGLGACAYDPYYSGGTRTSVGVGYGDGYGYGGSSFNTSVFWSTGDTRWGYDPYVRSYYDYNRRAYYDPYLYGYYPVGYRPPVLIGVPHPSGYRQGWCPPPRRITNVTVSNYRNRESAYRSTNHRWANDVRYDRTHRSAPRQTRNRDDYRSRHDATFQGGRATSPGGPGATRAYDTRTQPSWDGRRGQQTQRTVPQASQRHIHPAARQTQVRPYGDGRPSQSATRDQRGAPERFSGMPSRAGRQVQPPAHPAQRNVGRPQPTQRFQPPVPQPRSDNSLRGNRGGRGDGVDKSVYGGDRSDRARRR